MGSKAFMVVALLLAMFLFISTDQVIASESTTSDASTGMTKTKEVSVDGVLGTVVKWIGKVSGHGARTHGPDIVYHYYNSRCRTGICCSNIQFYCQSCVCVGGKVGPATRH